MSGYTITHTVECEPDFNRAEGKKFRNKDEVIEYLIWELYNITGDTVIVHKGGK